eukprot:257281-Pleurochrysis_carterae.AAC.1
MSPRVSRCCFLVTDLRPREQHGYRCGRAAFVMRMCLRLGMVDFLSCACLSIGSPRTMCGPIIPLVMWSTWTPTSA